MCNKRTALVTGASRGIGAAIAKGLARDGFHLALTCRSPKAEIDAVAEECRSLGAEVLCLYGDCGDSAVCKTWIGDTLEHFGHLDVLVNNAGVTRDGLLMRMTDDAFDEVIRTNLNSAFYLCREASRPMVKQRFGRIVNIASVAGTNGNAGQCNYAASKGALIALTKSVAKELGSRGVTANAVAPGLIASDMTDNMPPEAREALLKSVLPGRMGTAEEVAGLVCYLCSENAGYITGQTIIMDGGLTL